MKKAFLFFVLAILGTEVFAADFSKYDFDKEIYMTFEDGSGRWVKIYKINEYDAKGNEIHTKRSDGDENWYEYEYDAKGNIIHTKSSDGFEYWYKYEYQKDSSYIVITYETI